MVCRRCRYLVNCMCCVCMFVVYVCCVQCLNVHVVHVFDLNAVLQRMQQSTCNPVMMNNRQLISVHSLPFFISSLPFLSLHQLFGQKKRPSLKSAKTRPSETSKKRNSGKSSRKSSRNSPLSETHCKFSKPHRTTWE